MKDDIIGVHFFEIKNESDEYHKKKLDKYKKKKKKEKNNEHDE